MVIMLFLYDLTSLFLLMLVITCTIPSCYSYLFEGQSVNCEGSYNCGSIHGVKYPFWGGGSRSRLCGNDNLYLQCKNKQTTLSVPHFFRNTIGYKPSEFHVLTINQSSFRMRIVHDNLWKNICLESSSLYSLYKYSTTLINGLRYTVAQGLTVYVCVKKKTQLDIFIFQNSGYLNSESVTAG